MIINREKPIVSVVLPVFNCEDYVCDAVRSILDQTFTNFEFIIIDDGSTDNTYKKIKKIKDPRIILIKQKNKGLPTTLNESFKRARGKYLARQDADDFSYKSRLEKQVAFLDSNPNVGIVGTWAEIWSDQKKTNRTLKHSCTNSKILFDSLFDSSFVHSSVMIRKKVFSSIGGYNPKYKPVEDYEYWTRILEKYDGANIPEVLHIYRELPSSMIRAEPEKNTSKILKISSDAITRLVGENYNKLDIYNLVCLSHQAFNFMEGKPNIHNLKNIFRVISKKLYKVSYEKPDDLDKHILRKLKSVEIYFYSYKYLGSQSKNMLVNFFLRFLRNFYALKKYFYEKK
jgi:glycosyltransferase involved in cell wall biosynthesis